MTCRTKLVHGRGQATRLHVCLGSVVATTNGEPVSPEEAMRQGAILDAVLSGEMSIEDANNAINQRVHKAK